MEKLKTFLKGTVKSLGFSGVALDKIMRVIYLIVFIVALKAAYSLFNSDYTGEFVFYEKDPETGKTEILKFRAKKENHHNLTLNMLSIYYKGDLSKGVIYQRNVYDAFGFSFWIGAGYETNVLGKETYLISLSVGF